MDEAANVITRGWLVMLVGTALLVGGLVALCFPVFLDSYDSWGIRVKCGNGYHSDLLQATIAATNYVDQCHSAVALRRAWTVPVVMIGGLLLILDLVAWARGGPPGSAVPTSTQSDGHTDMSMHTAALLDRRYRSRRARSSNTTI